MLLYVLLLFFRKRCNNYFKFYNTCYKNRFFQKLVDLYGNVTSNIKNGVSGIIFDWKPFSYATYYKIVISQYDENNIQQQTETYHVQHPTNNLSLKWNFPNKKSQFENVISYTTIQLLQRKYKCSGTMDLGEDGQTYTKNFYTL